MDGFRGDVEGLRALAIGIVLLAHAGVGVAAGGYVGVDVFFLISGFLITRLLVGERERTGRIALPRFYARRIKRLMPQALTAAVVVAVVAPLVLSPLNAVEALDDVTAASVYAMNWHLAAGSVDYFASGAADGPLDHFWSLAVEEQFYIVWPLLLLVVGRRWLGPALGLLTLASLAYAVQRVGAAPEQAYFSTGTRAWELGLGGLLALGLDHRRPGPRTSKALAWGGVAAVAVATVTFGADTAVPAWPTLLPVLGAAALVAAGSGATALPTRALSLRPVRFVGRISYAWYVWHWPVLIFAASAWGPLTTAQGLAVIAASLVPTLVTHRWIEEPVRRSRFAVPRFALATAPVAAAFALAVAAAASWGIPAQATSLRPSPLAADDDRGRSFRDGCLVDADALRSPPCVYGSGPDTVVLFGDSHAMQWFPALERVARTRRWRLVVLTKSGCPPATGHVRSIRRYSRACDRWREYAIDRIAAERPALVVAGGATHYHVYDGRWRSRQESDRRLRKGYVATATRVAAIAPLVVIRDAPRPPFDVPGCVAAHLRHLRRCAFRRPRADAISPSVRGIAGVTLLDPRNQFCPRRLCPAVIGDALVYRHEAHVTATYAGTTWHWLARALQ